MSLSPIPQPAPSQPPASPAAPIAGATPAATGAGEASTAEPILCQHCGRTASNGISCEGYCVADSGY